MNFNFIFGQLAHVGKDNTAHFSVCYQSCQAMWKRCLPATFVYHDVGSPGVLFSSHTSCLFWLAKSACAVFKQGRNSMYSVQTDIKPVGCFGAHPLFAVVVSEFVFLFLYLTLLSFYFRNSVVRHRRGGEQRKRTKGSGLQTHWRRRRWRSSGGRC